MANPKEKTKDAAAAPAAKGAAKGAAKEAAPAERPRPSALKAKYKETVVPALAKKFGFTNPMTIPKPQKIVVNMAFGIVDKDAQKGILEDLAKITAQKPSLRPARKSISNFKLREGMPVGAKVTLRGDRMWDFLDKFINSTLPRIRDFRGVPTRGFDGRGNYTMGLKEQTIFPEIDLAKHSAPEQGMDITVVTSAPTNEQARELLTLLGMPFAGR